MNSTTKQTTRSIASKARTSLRESTATTDSASPPQTGAGGCGILSRYPVLAVLSFAVAGIGVGIGLSFWKPEDAATKETALTWIGLIGDLFIRSLNCVILPLVFANVIISVVEMMMVGKANSVGWKTIGLYVSTTALASVFAIVTTIAMMGLYSKGEFGDEQVPATIALGCSNGAFMTEMPDGNLACSANYSATDPRAQFSIFNSDGTLMTRTAEGGESTAPADDISLSDTIYQGVFEKLFTDNIVGSFVDGNFAAVVFFAIIFGVALSRVLETSKQTENNGGLLLGFLNEVNKVLIIVITWIIMVTPFAVLSLIASTIGHQEDIVEAFENVGYLITTIVMAMLLHLFVSYTGLFALFTKSNPFPYLRKLAPAQTTALATASSAATIPMTLKSVKSTGRVNDTIANFVVPLGATINMDGTAIYLPCACIWLAVLNGITPSIGSYLMLVIISTIGSVGAAPVPASGLVLILTAYNTVFGTTGTPEGFSFIIATDWILDRLCTALNITGDAVVCGIVSHLCPFDDEEQGSTTSVVAEGDEEEGGELKGSTTTSAVAADDDTDAELDGSEAEIAFVTVAL